MNNYSNDTNNFRKPQGGSRPNFRGSDKRGSDRRGSDRRSSDRPRFDSRSSGPTQMHDAVCAECGDNCRVPFMPSSGKPVFCSNCFEKRGNGDNESRRPSFGSNKRSFSNSAPRSASRPQENYNKQFEIINSKLDKIFKMLNSSDQVNNESKVVTKKVISEVIVPEFITKSSEDKAEKVEPTKIVKKKAKAKKVAKEKVDTTEELN